MKKDNIGANISTQFVLSLFEDDYDKMILKLILDGESSKSIVEEIVKKRCEGQND